MRAFLAAHPGDQAGSLKRYSFADTGLDEAELRERARPYQEFFDVETESHQLIGRATARTPATQGETCTTGGSR